MKIVLNIAIIAAIGGLAIHILHWANDTFVWAHPERVIWMDFDIFQRSYNLTPKKWTLEDGWAVYHRTPYDDAIVRFHFFDWRKYRRWCKDLNSNRLKKEQSDIEYQVLSDIRDEVNAEVAKREQAAREKADHLTSILKRIQAGDPTVSSSDYCQALLDWKFGDNA